MGNSDILGHVIYQYGKVLLNIFTSIRKMYGVEKNYMVRKNLSIYI
jgi:hypothetical protein